MKVFISWSGERSRIFANAFGTWLEDLIQAVDTFVSSEDIDKGSRWSNVINNQISLAGFGIVCLTKDTVDRRWILFEAGALSRHFATEKAEDVRVATLVLDDLETGAIADPLRQFNPTRAVKDDMLRLVKSINKAVGPEAGVKPDRLEVIYERMWGILETAIKLLQETPPEEVRTDTATADKPGDRIEEIASGVRELLRRQVVNPIEPPQQRLLSTKLRQRFELILRDTFAEFLPGVRPQIFWPRSNMRAPVVAVEVPLSTEIEEIVHKVGHRTNLLAKVVSMNYGDSIKFASGESFTFFEPGDAAPTEVPPGTDLAADDENVVDASTE